MRNVGTILLLTVALVSLGQAQNRLQKHSIPERLVFSIVEVKYQNLPDIAEQTMNPEELVRKKIIDYARSYLGTPYKYAGMSEQGFDCSGFASYVYNLAGINIPHGSGLQAKMGTTVSLKESKKGDLIFFGYRKKGGIYRTSHTAIVYANNNGKVSIIHSDSRGVTIDEVGSVTWESYYGKRLLFVKRLI